MRIGIITQPLHTNYGGLLQNYALQSVLKKMGHEVITINQVGFYVPLWKLIASTVKTLLGRVVGRDKKFISIFGEYRRKYVRKNTVKFVDKYINTTIKIKNKKILCRVAKSLCLDAYIVGSDQVWRPLYNTDLYTSFLDFTDSLQVRRIAYAASFGVDNWEFSDEQTARCRELIQSFDAVSVRESSGIELCKQYLGVNAYHVLDPTMLLDACDYAKLVEQENEKISFGFLLTYVLDNDKNKQSYINNLAAELKLPSFSVMPELDLDSATAKCLEKCVFPSVTKWIRGFIDAKFVVCDSFHGVVFSIIFNKEFMVFGNEERGMARFRSLLKMFDLEDRIITDRNDFSVVVKPIDWNRVNRIREEMKDFSMRFLLNYLEG